MSILSNNAEKYPTILEFKKIQDFLSCDIAKMES